MGIAQEEQGTHNDRTPIADKGRKHTMKRYYMREAYNTQAMTTESKNATERPPRRTERAQGTRAPPPTKSKAESAKTANTKSHETATRTPDPRPRNADRV